MSCGNKFLNATSGLLVASDDEVDVIRSSKEGLKPCKQQCRQVERCRAIGYDENNPKICRIYSVSTNTAKIYSDVSEGRDSSMKIYDRQCHKIGG